MFRRELLSTVFRNVPDAGGGAAPAPKPEDAPVVAAPAAPVADAPVVADAAAAPAVVDAPVVVDPAVAPAAEPPVDQPAAPLADGEPKKDFAAETLLTAEEPKPGDPPKEAPKADDKPAEPLKDAKDPAGDKPAEAEGAKAPDAQPAAPKEAPVYTYEFPEGVKFDADVLKPVNETFAKLGVAPEAAKELMGLHVAEMQKYATNVVQQSQDDQRRVWAETRGLWRDEIRSDEQIGGAGYETTLRQAAEVRDKLVPKENMAAFNRMLLVTGVGDHPEFVRFMKSAHRYVGEPGMPGVQGNPTAHNGQPGGKRRLRDTYAKPA